jgi:hypothetical protein
LIEAVAPEVFQKKAQSGAGADPFEGNGEVKGRKVAGPASPSPPTTERKRQGACASFEVDRLAGESVPGGAHKHVPRKQVAVADAGAVDPAKHRRHAACQKKPQLPVCGAFLIRAAKQFV